MSFVNFKKICLIPVLLAFIAPVKDISDVVRFQSNDLELFNVIETKNSKDKKVYSIADLTYSGNQMPYITDLILSFNGPSSSIARDDTKKYVIRYASYSFVKDKGVLGGGGANFYKKDHRVEVETEKNLWLGRCGDLGSFSLDLRFLPANVRNTSVLFSRVGFLSGKKNGIEVILKDGRISAMLYGMFKDSSGRMIDAALHKGRSIRTGKWHHFMLSYDRVSGKLSKLLNGAEEEVIYVTETGEPYVNVLEPEFSCRELPIAVIGKNYFGYIDELRITYRHIEDLKKETEIAFRKYQEVGLQGRNPVNREGVITSSVLSFPSTGTMVTLFKWDEIIKNNTFIWTEFRISDSLFDKDDNGLKWYRITNNQKNIFLKKAGNDYLRGKYYQWRTHLLPDPDGKASPSIYNIELHYQLDTPPAAPHFVEVVKSGDRVIRLKWKKNVDHDIFGYRIYYGLNSRKYEGVIGYINGKRITNEMAKSWEISVELTNEVIEENRTLHKQGILKFPVLKNNTLYFLSISAYDSYKVDTSFNHESKLSEEVKARPFAGSEINN